MVDYSTYGSKVDLHSAQHENTNTIHAGIDEDEGLASSRSYRAEQFKKDYPEIQGIPDQLSVYQLRSLSQLHGIPVRMNKRQKKSRLYDVD